MNNHRPLSISRITGWLIFTLILFSIAHGLHPEIPRLLAAAAAWTAGLLLIGQLKGLPRTQALIMFLLGSGALLYGWTNTGQAEIEKAFSTNQSLLAMLAAVSFLRLVTLPENDPHEKPPLGPGALWRTLLGVHLFGAVINLSAVIILGDRLSSKRPLSPLQAIVLSRGFAMASHWSPFFAAMGIALTHAPGSQLITLSATGAPVTFIALLVSGWILSRKKAASQFIGYPMHFDALWIPGLLAAAVLILHFIYPDIPVLTIITLLSVALSLFLLVIRNQARGIQQFVSHIEEGLPRMSGELSLFLAAGVLAVGVSALVQSSGIDLVPEQFGAFEASVILVVMVIAAIAGIHPVISIATAGGILTPLVNDPNLLGITFLMAWALGISTSRFSALIMAMQGRYRIKPRNFLRWNGGFTLFMLLLDTLALHLYAALNCR